MTQRVALPYVGLDPLPWTRPALTTFSTWLNRGGTGGNSGNAAIATDNANGLPLVIDCDASSANAYPYLTGLLKPIGAPPWTITVGLAAAANWNGLGGQAGAPWAPLILFNSGTGKAVVCWWQFYTSSNAYIYHYDTTYDDGGNGNPTQVSNGVYGFSCPDYFGWFRAEHNGTTLTFSVSAEGVLFFPIYSEAANAFVSSFDKVGFGIERSSIGIDALKRTAAVLWSWTES